MAEQETTIPVKGEEQNTLAELLKEERKQSRLIRVLMLANVVLAAGMLIALVIIIPRLTSMVTQAEEALAQVDSLTEQADQALSDVMGLADQAEASLGGIDEVIQNANTILVENASGMAEAIDNFNSVDFENLNQAIQDLSDAIAPMASFARLFG